MLPRCRKSSRTASPRTIPGLQGCYARPVDSPHRAISAWIAPNSSSTPNGRTRVSPVKKTWEIRSKTNTRIGRISLATNGAVASAFGGLSVAGYAVA